MRRIATFFLIISIFANFVQADVAVPATKEGTKCSEIGKISGKLTCISLGKKKFWYQITLPKGVKKYPLAATDCYREEMKAKGLNQAGEFVILSCKYPSTVRGNENPKWIESDSNPALQGVGFSSTCEIDANSPKEWEKIEKFLAQTRCNNFFKYVPYILPSTQPVSNLSKKEAYLNPNECKINQPSGQFYPWRGFAQKSDARMYDYFQSFASPRPNMRVQVIPVGWSDLPYSGSPQQDYGMYFKFLKEYVENTSDNGSNFSIEIPESYIQMPKPLGAYKDIERHDKPTPEKDIFWKDAITAADFSIDFTGVTVAILIVTPNTPIDKFGSNPDGSGISKEGVVPHILSLPPLDLSSVHRNSLFLSPQMMIHELTHAGLDMGDYYETGIWSHVGNGRFDPLGWDKYISGFMGDSQIYCVPNNSVTTSWIVPSSAKGAYSKLIVIPLSKSKVLIVESMRSAGYKYKLPLKNQGALVYSVDLAIVKHGEGTFVYEPFGRAKESEIMKYDAALKLGESIVVSNVKISVIETGSFGDVIKVEKAT